MGNQLRSTLNTVLTSVIFGSLLVSGCNMPTVDKTPLPTATISQPTAVSSLPTPLSREEKLATPPGKIVNPTELPATPAETPPGESIFGASFTPPDNSGGLQQVADARLRWTRVELIWARIEPERDARDWNNAAQLETQLQEITQSGINVVLILNESPNWALKDGFNCGAIREEYFDNFASFAKEAVERYSQAPYNVRYWELFNEPDAATILGCWGDPADINFFGGEYYGQMLKKVYPAMKSANPDAQVLVGGLLLDCDPINPPDLPNQPGVKKDCTPGRFLEGILSAGAVNSFDGVAFHAYDYYLDYGLYHNPNWNSSRVSIGSSAVAKAAYLRSTLEKFGVHDRYLINTEYALFCGGVDSHTCDPMMQEVEATKAYYAVQFMATAMAEDYRTAIWYSVFDRRNNALLNKDFSTKPVYEAMSFANYLIGSARFVQKYMDANFVVYEFLESKNKIWVTWTRDNQSHILDLPSTPSFIYMIGPDGKAYETENEQKISLDAAPAFILFKNP